MQIAHEIGAFPKIYATFQNGMAYKYFQGRTLNFNDLNNPIIIKDLSQKLYRYHNADVQAMDLVDMKGEKCEMDTTSKMSFKLVRDVIPKLLDTTEDPLKKPVFDKYRKTYTNEYFLEEFDFLEDIQKETKVNFKV